MNSENKVSITKLILSLPVLVAALGYLVDMYDLFLFNIVRVPSLKELGLENDQILKQGLNLLNIQMAGMLMGGIAWGILGDKRGRLSVLFGSIIIYSIANIANGLIHSLPAYYTWRFIAGFGLAGELGAGITLVTEILPSRVRGYGTTLVATLGVVGALLAYVTAHTFSWRTSYLIGGALGFLLLIMRFRVFESGVFIHLKEKDIKRGQFFKIFTDKHRIIQYMTGIFMGMPIWFVVGILITFSPEFGRAMQLDEAVDAGKAVLLTFSGQVAGNLVTGSLSQYWQSRKKVILIFMLLSFSFVLIYLLSGIHSILAFYIICVCLGFCSGYWTLFITVAAELFGSDIRATVATTIPNFVRATVIPLSAVFTVLKAQSGVLKGALEVAVGTYIIGMVALYFLEETFHKDLDYIEKP